MNMIVFSPLTLFMIHHKKSVNIVLCCQVTKIFLESLEFSRLQERSEDPQGVKKEDKNTTIYRNMNLSN